MRIQVVSDLHQEFCLSWLIKKEADLLVVAGDLQYAHCLKCDLKQLKRWFKYIIFVPGNHEYYHESIESGNQLIDSIDIENVYILRRKSVTIEGVEFIGATGWIDHSYKEAFVGGDTHFLAQQKNHDWDYIDRLSKTYKQEGQKDSYYIKEALKASTAMKKVVVTHFVPLPECRGARNFAIQDAAFINDYAKWCFNYPADVWIHGHSHSFLERKLHDTLFVRNAVGYYWKSKELNAYKNGYVVEV